MRARSLALSSLVLSLPTLLALSCGGPTPKTAPSTSNAAAATATLPAHAAAPPAPTPLPEGWPYVAHAATAHPHGMVASDASLATKVGVDTLAAGGNAVDAAVSIAFALAVVYPMAGNLGGGGFAVAHMGSDTRALDFREAAPAAATRDMYLDASGKDTGGAREGYKASGVPGSVAGLYELHRTLGSKKKSWSDLIAPAIKLAEEGFVVEDAFAESLGFVADRLKKFPASAALFLPNGQPLKAGSTWKNPELAVTLRRISEKGPAGFYEGPTAEAIAADMKANGGLLTQADLKAYAPKWRTPLVFTYRGQTISAMPPPSSGGVTLAMICHILEGYDLPHMAWHSPDELHYAFEAMRRSFAARNARLGDPDFVANPTDELLSPKWTDAQRATISPDHATPSTEINGRAGSGNGPHTTHFAVVDDAGNAVSLTTTINWWYGSAVTIPKTGIVMNNEMDDFASVPGSANGFGLVQGEPNAIAPGKRMLSSMAPTIVSGPDGKVSLVIGAAGGPMIITTVFELLSSVVDHGMDPVAALNAPRFHMQHLPDVVGYEQQGLSKDVQGALEAMGYSFKERGHIADAMAIGRVAGGWLGAAEPRRKGSLADGP
jgi:gamma-glutamyltranspeptidase/glutathione hydrolase